MVVLTTVQSYNYEDNAEAYYLKNFYSFVELHKVSLNYRLHVKVQPQQVRNI